MHLECDYFVAKRFLYSNPMLTGNNFLFDTNESVRPGHLLFANTHILIIYEGIF